MTKAQILMRQVAKSEGVDFAEVFLGYSLSAGFQLGREALKKKRQKGRKKQRNYA